MADRKLDLFDLLKKMDNPKIADVYQGLSEEERKEFSPFMVMNWMSGTNDPRQIMMLNEFVNPYVFTIGSRKHLMSRLLQAASSKVPKRYKYPTMKAANTKNALSKQVVAEYLELSSREIELLDPFPLPEEILAMAADLGMQKEDMTKLQKEMKG